VLALMALMGAPTPSRLTLSVDQPAIEQTHGGAP
jgi:hypothetical protein